MPPFKTFVFVPFLVGLTLLAQAMAAAPSGQWLYATKDTVGNRYYFDRNSLKTEPGQQVSYRLGLLIRDNRQVAGQSPAFAVMDNTEDCRENQNLWGLRTEFFSQKGQPIAWEAATPQPIKPTRDSAAETVNHLVCYCARYPDSIVCQSATENWQTINDSVEALRQR